MGDEVADSVGCGGEGGERRVSDAGEVYGSREGGEQESEWCGEGVDRVWSCGRGHQVV